MNTPDTNTREGGAPAAQSPAAERQLEELLAAAREAGVADGDLDDRIIDEHLAAASAVNNEGVSGQVRYLLEAYGAEAVRRDLLAMKRPAGAATRAVIIQDDKDSHGEGCECDGGCNSQGKSFGAAIFLVPDGVAPEDVDTAELRLGDPLERLYRASPEAAVEAAREECRRRGITVIED